MYFWKNSWHLLPPGFSSLYSTLLNFIIINLRYLLFLMHRRQLGQQAFACKSFLFFSASYCFALPAEIAVFLRCINGKGTVLQSSAPKEFLWIEDFPVSSHMLEKGLSCTCWEYDPAMERHIVDKYIKRIIQSSFIYRQRYTYIYFI